MKRADFEVCLDSLVEKLAAIEHERWAHWQRYMHESGERLDDGSLVLPAELVQRWEKQIATQFADLSASEKESDREQVRKYLPVIADAFSTEAGREDETSVTVK